MFFLLQLIAAWERAKGIDMEKHNFTSINLTLNCLAKAALVSYPPCGILQQNSRFY